MIILGSIILSFGIYNIHSQCGIAEGGELGIELLLQHFFSISPAITALVFDLIFFIVGIFVIGNKFAIKAVLGTCTYSISYYLIEKFTPVIFNLHGHQLVAAIVGATFVGVGSGLVVRMGGASGGDDSLSLILSKITGLPVSICYFLFDIFIILISLSYINFNEIIYSFITALISSIIIGLMQKIKV